jgi:integrase
VFKALKPLVADKPVTASRVRGRIETVLDFARAAGRRNGDNPADKAVIGHLLPLRSEKAGVKHQPALPFAKLPALMTELCKMQGLPARLLEVIILSGMRLDAVRPARGAEFDLAAAVPVWVIPQSRMKNLGRDQRVPLVGRALAIARELTAGRDPEAPVFGNDKPIGPNAIRKSVLPKVLKSIGHEAPAVTHGFRSCMKDWCHESTGFPNEVIEQALGASHQEHGRTQLPAGRLFERRRALMAAWDRYCNGEEVAEVIELRA